MMANVGTIDRIIRAVAGIVLLILAALALTGGAQIAALVVGIVSLGTSGLKFCPAYRLLGLKTCRL